MSFLYQYDAESSFFILYEEITLYFLWHKNALRAKDAQKRNLFIEKVIISRREFYEEYSGNLIEKRKQWEILAK